MKFIYSNAQKIEKFGPAMGGVFSYGDLYNLISAGAKIQQHERILKRLIGEKILYKIRRGIYTTALPDLWVLACRLKPGAYVSTDSILAKNLLIGTVPALRVSAVYASGKKQILRTRFGEIRYFSIQKKLMFGYRPMENGVNVADSEKAYLDMLYFYAKGARFVVDPFRDVAIYKLDLKKLRRYLRQYRNPRFEKFVLGVINESK